eukprot:Sspe_Gene.78732::Locus_49281_Transcript_2_5_Confidence_0.765_Length_606::g.78732::m.78732
MGVHYLPATGDCNATESGHQFLAQRYYKCGQGDWVIGDDRGHGAKHVLCERPKLRLKRFEKGDSLYSKRMRVLSALKDDTRSVEERKALLRGLRTPPPRKPHEGDKYTFSHPSPTAEQLALFMRKPRYAVRCPCHPQQPVPPHHPHRGARGQLPFGNDPQPV